MPKARTNAVIGHNSDAEMRAWVTICENLLTASGLVRTSDTGQVVPSTVTRPAGVGLASGYSIWRFNDPLQASAPVFLKVEYGTGAGSNVVPCLWLTVGQGSDGVGGITNVVAARSTVPQNGSDAALTRDYFAVHNAWGAALIVGAGGSVSPTQFGMGFALQRTCDSDGTPSADGLLVHVPNASATAVGAGRAFFAQFLPTLALKTPSAETLALLPMGLTDYVVGISPQIFPTWCALPKVRPMNFLAVGPASGAPGIGQTFTMAVVGTQARTYINVGCSIGRNFWPSMTFTTYIMWED